MTVDVGIWCEQSLANNLSNYTGALNKVQGQIENALSDANMSYDVSTYTPTCSVPYPNKTKSHNNNVAFDDFIDSNYSYHDDSNILCQDMGGGVTFTSAMDPNSTPGNMTRAGTPNLDSSKPVKNSGSVTGASHYQSIYTVLHELSHALDAPTGSNAIGRYYKLNGDYHRTPAHTKYATYNDCNSLLYNWANNGWDIGVLTYFSCTQNYLTDQ